MLFFHAWHKQRFQEPESQVMGYKHISCFVEREIIFLFPKVSYYSNILENVIQKKAVSASAHSRCRNKRDPWGFNLKTLWNVKK
jgi:hypothetical protein